MKLPVQEPLSARYLYLSPENIVHIFMPIVSGTDIGLDNTCKAVYSLQEFFDKGSNSNKQDSLKGGLLTYQEALESDISLLGRDLPSCKPKQERLAQIKMYLEVLTHIEKHKELDCLNSGFPSYPRPLEGLMQDRATSNLYSIVLRPADQDGYLRTEAANPIFSVAHRSVSRKIEEVAPLLQQELIKAYTPLTFRPSDLKFQVMNEVLTQLGPHSLPVNAICFGRLRDLLHGVVLTQLKQAIDFTKDAAGKPLEYEQIYQAMVFDSQTTPEAYMEALLSYCAGNLFDIYLESPFNQFTKAEEWSIGTQFLLGMTNFYCITRGLINSDTNFGRILDSRADLTKALAQTLAKAQKDGGSIEGACLKWMNHHTAELELKRTFSTEDINAIKKDFACRYAQIKGSPHFDEFFLLDTQKQGNFVLHQGSICTSFAKFARSPLLEVPQELLQALDKACTAASHLGVEIPHENPIEAQEEVDINTSSMDKASLQALYEKINTYKNPEVKAGLLVQLKRERPDFNPKIDAKQFLQHVAYGQQNEAEELLKKDPDSAQELLTAKNIPFTDYSGRTFQCTAYEYAYWAKDTYMCRMLERHMEDTTKSIIHEYVQAIEELEISSPRGLAFFQEPAKPRGLAYTQKGTEYRSAHFDLMPLKDALKVYIKAYNESRKTTETDWQALNAVWIKVGLPQRDVPAHIAQEYCHPERSFYDITKNKGLLDASKKDNLERQLKFYNYETDACDSWFTPGASGENSGLGFSFAIWQDGLVGCAAALAAGVGRSPDVVTLDLSAIEAIEEVRTKDLKESLEILAAPSNLKTPVVHSS